MTRIEIALNNKIELNTEQSITNIRCSHETDDFSSTVRDLLTQLKLIAKLNCAEKNKIEKIVKWGRRWVFMLNT